MSRGLQCRTGSLPCPLSIPRGLMDSRMTSLGVAVFQPYLPPK